MIFQDDFNLKNNNEYLLLTLTHHLTAIDLQFFGHTPLTVIICIAPLKRSILILANCSRK